MRRSGFSLNPHTAAGRGEWRGQTGGKLRRCDCMFREEGSGLALCHSSAVCQAAIVIVQRGVIFWCVGLRRHVQEASQSTPSCHLAPTSHCFHGDGAFENRQTHAAFVALITIPADNGCYSKQLVRVYWWSSIILMVYAVASEAQRLKFNWLTMLQCVQLRICT